MLTSFQDIGPTRNLFPVGEERRLNYYRQRQRWYDGQTAGLPVGIETTDPALDTLVRTNWFRRVATFYPEFMLADRPGLMLNGTGQAELQQAFDRQAPQFWATLQMVNTDALVNGIGVMAWLPDVQAWVRSNPLYWFEVADRVGRVVGDILVFIIGDVNPGQSQPQEYRTSFAHVYRLPVAGPITWSAHTYQAQSLGDTLETEQYPAPDGRRVVMLYPNQNQTSVFDDMASPMGSVIRNQTYQDFSIKRNSRPHLFGPDGAVEVDDNGNAELNPSGMYFPLSEGDPTPGYLQWDTKADAVSMQYRTQLQNALAMGGLNEMIFNPSLQLGELSGSALRRLSLPMLARVNHLKQANHAAVSMAVRLWAAWNGYGGVQVADGDVQIDWKFDDLYTDMEDKAPPGTGEKSNDTETE